MQKYDLVVVGAGPAGSTLAVELLKLNKKANVCILEEHSRPGTPQQCSGLFSKNITDVAVLKKKEIIQEIKGANFYSPSGKCIEIKTSKTQAYVVDRKLFDFRLAEEAKRKGAELMLNTRFISAKKIDDLYEIKIFDKSKNKERIIYSRYIAGCDGAGSAVANAFDFPKMQCLYGYGIFLKAKTKQDFDFIKSNKVALYLGKKRAPEFFLWEIPRIGENTIEIGVASEKNPVILIEKFIKEKKINKGNIASKMGGLIPFEIRKQIVKSGVVLVGDSAGQVKATTGGGVIWGMKCAVIAAKALDKAIQYEDSRYLKEYTAGFDKKARPELKRLKMARSFLNSRTDRQLNAAFKSLDNERILQFVKENGDMDSITPAIVCLLKKPQLWFDFAKAIVGFVI